MSLASDLKMALENTGDVELTGEQQQVVDNLLEKVDSVSAPKMEPPKHGLVQENDRLKSLLRDLVDSSPYYGLLMNLLAKQIWFPIRSRVNHNKW